MPTEGKAKHGVLGLLLGVLALALPGAFALIVGVLRDVLPAGWLQYQAPFTETMARGVALAVGVALLVVAHGYFSFTKMGWFGYAVWALVGLVTFVLALRSDPEVRWHFEISPLFFALGLPYLWYRRRDFGIGSQPPSGGG